MHRCLRCLQSFLGTGDYCPDCRRCLLRLWAELGTEERPVLEFSAVASMAVHGEPVKVVRRWVVR